MDWLIGLLLLIVGGIIGYFVAKYFNKGEKNTQDNAKNEQTVAELMTQQAVQHLQQSKDIAEKISQQSAALTQQLANYEHTIIAQKSGGKDVQLSYFGEHASTYLRHKSEDPSREKASANVQPLDFSSEGSGLFSGSENSEIKETK